jgi:outer membrane protein assembly factor BamB
MRKVKTITDIINLSLEKDNYAILKKNGDIFFNEKLISKNGSNYVYISNFNFLFFEINSDQKTYFCDFLDLKINSVNNLNLIFASENNNVFLAFKFNFQTKDHKIVKFNFAKNLEIKELFEYPKYSIIYSNSTNCVLLDNNNIYSFYNHITETTLWQFSVADLGASKVNKIMGVFGQVLVVVAEMVWPEHIFVGLDVATGAMLWQVKCHQYLMPSNTHYYAPNNSLICLVDDNLWEYSLTEQSIIRDKHFPEALTKGEVSIRAGLGSLVGDLFYFAGEDMNKPITSAFVGVFDIVKEKLIDIIDLESNGKFSLGGNSRPKVANNKIYTLDTANTLHILELEEGDLKKT